MIERDPGFRFALKVEYPDAEFACECQFFIVRGETNVTHIDDRRLMRVVLRQRFTRAVEPHELAFCRSRAAGLINHESILRDGKNAAPHPHVVANAIHQRGCRSRQRARCWIKRLRHQRHVRTVKKIARCVLCRRVSGYNEVGLRAVDRPKVDSVLFGIASGVIGREENKMFAIGQKPGPAMRVMFRLIHDRGRSYRAALRAHFHQRVLKIRGEDNHIVAAPASPSRIRSIGDHRNRAAGGGNLHQFAVGKESNVAAVRRPERMRRSHRALHRLCRIAAQRPYPQHLAFPGMGDERDLVALRRQHRHAARVASCIESKLVWRRNFCMQRYGLLGGFCPAVSRDSGYADEND